MKSDTYSKTPMSKSHFPATAETSRRHLPRLEAPFLARLRRAVLPVGLLLASAWVATAKSAAITATLEPAEIAEMVAFLGRPDMWSVNGQSVLMDAGWLST